MVGCTKYWLLAFTVFTLSTQPDWQPNRSIHLCPRPSCATSRQNTLRDRRGGARGARQNISAKGWQVQSSCDDRAGGDKISSAGFEAGRWHRTDIPATVVGVLVTDKTYPLTMERAIRRVQAHMALLSTSFSAAASPGTSRSAARITATAIASPIASVRPRRTRRERHQCVHARRVLGLGEPGGDGRSIETTHQGWTDGALTSLSSSRHLDHTGLPRMAIRAPNGRIRWAGRSPSRRHSVSR